MTMLIDREKNIGQNLTHIQGEKNSLKNVGIKGELHKLDRVSTKTLQEALYLVMKD